MNCPYCNKPISDKLVIQSSASIIGSSRSKAKIRASQINGAKGGRPPTKKSLRKSRK